MSDEPKKESEHNPEQPPPIDPYATSDKPSPPGKSTATFYPDELGGTMIGPYKLLQLMGKGGMGAVWMAEQTEPVQRRVAIKIVKPGYGGDQVLARFEAERQALAMMDHPNIAKVLDAGATADGKPYFVMELVKGVPFTKYCDQEHLTPAERLALFIPVCNAVQHAHQKGIIHRDLKPSNVLIALYDGKPVPKVIDFGIAKATQQKLTERTLFTEVGQIVGTLEYMAPEQAELNNLDIDTRADIYSLGVMLYELLTGSPPFSAKQLQSNAFMEMLRLIKEVEPAKPSTKLSNSDDLPAIAAKRKLEPKKLSWMVQGDLDWIVMKCLEKDRVRRYETANQLGEELNRYLADEPVQAGPPSVGYRAKKFLRRNKGPVLAAGLVLFALIAGIIGTSIGLVEADKATEKAMSSAEKEREAAAAEKVATQKALEAAEKERQANLTAQKRLEEVEKANALVESFFTDVFPKIGWIDRDRGEYYLTTDISTTSFTAQPLETRFGEFVEKANKGAIENPATLVRVQNSFGRYLYLETKIRKAIEVLDSARRTSEQLLGADHPDTVATLENLAAAYERDEQWAKAQECHEKILRVRKSKPGPNHSDTLDTMNSLAFAYCADGQPAKALPLYEATLAMRKAKLGPDHPKALITMRNLAVAYLEAKNPGKALPLFDEHLEAKRKKLEPTRTNFFDFDLHFAVVVLRKHEQHAAIEPMLREWFEIQKKYNPENWCPFYFKVELGGNLLDQKKYANAEPLLKEGYEGLKQRETMMDLQAKMRLPRALERLVQLYDATGNAAEADRWRKELAARKAAEKEPKK